MSIISTVHRIIVFYKITNKFIIVICISDLLQSHNKEFQSLKIYNAITVNITRYIFIYNEDKKVTETNDEED
ncbi:hypothetical protein V1477_014521 [Vespula maculifrons]|uniref:Uncharacterized protein n=1 Tax=Vespula maculifrons TaxID=7453 RepID=A0ABD2BI11_VESMC